MFKVYLAGPIQGLSYEGATDWRKWAQNQLAVHGIDGYSPMRAKDFLAGLEDVTFQENWSYNPFATSRGIMARDYNDCITANALLINFLESKTISAGTAMELAWAYHAKIPTIVVAERDNPHLNHPMIKETVDFHVTTLAEGVQIVKAVLLPEVV